MSSISALRGASGASACFTLASDRIYEISCLPYQLAQRVFTGVVSECNAVRNVYERFCNATLTTETDYFSKTYDGMCTVEYNEHLDSCINRTLSSIVLPFTRQKVPYISITVGTLLGVAVLATGIGLGIIYRDKLRDGFNQLKMRFSRQGYTEL